MNTFVPEPTFAASAAVLDNSRLNKQLLEGRQMLNALAGSQKGFVNHPATNMWRGNEIWFYAYLAGVATECEKRGIAFENNWSTIVSIFEESESKFVTPGSGALPYWWSDPVIKDRIMWTHRANLYKKDPVWYADYKVDAITYDEAMSVDPLSVVCCAARRRVPGIKGLQPCSYYWPTHKE